MAMVSYLNLILIATVLFNKTCFATVVKGPRSQNKNPGEWAEFTCTVSCTHSIKWFVEGHKHHITETCTENSDGTILCKEIVQSCSSTSATTNYVETLRVLANPESAPSSIAVQCAAISLSLPTGVECTPFLSFSRFALLKVESPATQSTTPPSPTPTPTPSPVVCPEDHTVTHTVTQTVAMVVEATPLPNLDPVTASGNGEQ